MSMYSHNGRRGEISLYYEDEDIAVDIAEYPTGPSGARRNDAEMFIHYKAVPGLIAALERMRDTIEEKVRTRAEKAAESLVRDGVNPQGPDELNGFSLKRDPEAMESIALYYLRKAAELRDPSDEMPF